MSDCLVLVGLIGAGKTALAQSLAASHRAISFDDAWHGRIQKRQGRQPHHLVANIVRTLTRHDGDAVIDGWWTWEPRWWETRDDQTLALLRDSIKHVVRLVYLPMSSGDAFAAYKRKAETGMYVYSSLVDPEAYRESIPLRQEYLGRKVTEWAR